MTANQKPELPEIFRYLEPLLADAGSIDRVRRLTEALNAIPQLQSALREARQDDVIHLRDSGEMNYQDMATALDMAYSSVARIANNARSGKQYAKDKDQGGG